MFIGIWFAKKFSWLQHSCKAKNIHDSLSFEKSRMWRMINILSCYQGKLNTIGHSGGIVQNMIVGEILMDEVGLSHESLDAVLGESVTTIIWCGTYYPSFNKLRPDQSISLSTDIAMTNTKIHHWKHQCLKSPQQLHMVLANIQFIIVLFKVNFFKDFDGQQVFAFVKLVNKVLKSCAHALTVKKN